MNPLAALQQEVGEWHVGTFGEIPGSHLLAKFDEEAGEFLEAPTGEEAADVVLVLLAWAHRHGIDLQAEMERKFAVAKGRDSLARDRAKGLLANHVVEGA